MFLKHELRVALRAHHVRAFLLGIPQRLAKSEPPCAHALGRDDYEAARAAIVSSGSAKLIAGYEGAFCVQQTESLTYLAAQAAGDADAPTHHGGTHQLIPPCARPRRGCAGGLGWPRVC